MDALVLRDLRKRYSNGVEALNGINLTVREGDFFGLLGPNGAGKSTAIGIVTSLVRKSGGSVSIFGHDLDREPWEAKSCIGLVPQEFNFNGFETVLQIVTNQGGYYGLPRSIAARRAETYLRALSLWDKRDAIARSLSGGMKRRLMIARALVHDPKLLILDEPTAGVDIELRRSMWEFLREINAAGTTIILTTHYLEEAESLCRNVAIIDQGLIVKNTSVRNLLQQLNKEIFIFDTREAIAETPVLQGYQASQIDEHSFEVEVEKGRSLNALFEQLSEQGTSIVSMRNKANRLEEMFVAMISNGRGAEANQHGS